MTELKIVEEKLNSHIREDKADAKNLRLWLKSVETTVLNIRDNHLHSIEDKIDKLNTRLTTLEVNQKWMMLWGSAITSVATSVVTGLVVYFITK